MWDARLQALSPVVGRGSGTLGVSLAASPERLAAGRGGRAGVPSLRRSGPIGRTAVFRVAGLDCAWCLLCVLSCCGYTSSAMR